jgi:hypothetical protein
MERLMHNKKLDEHDLQKLFEEQTASFENKVLQNLIVEKVTYKRQFILLRRFVFNIACLLALLTAYFALELTPFASSEILKALAEGKDRMYLVTIIVIATMSFSIVLSKE